MTSLLQSKLLLKVPGIQHGFQTQNLSPPTPTLSCHQVHSNNVLFVDGLQPSQIKKTQTDGLLTWKKQCLGIQTADCLPILLTDLEGKMIAAIHAGWRGLDQGILEQTITHFKKYGLKPDRLVVAIGPCIQACCFEVAGSIIEDFQKKWGNLWDKANPPWYHSQPMNHNHTRTQAKATQHNLWLDLTKIASLQLQACEIPLSQIDSIGLCTYCGPATFASFRRATHEGVVASRQWSWIKKV